jgi:hypothetical protein
MNQLGSSGAAVTREAEEDWGAKDRELRYP